MGCPSAGSLTGLSPELRYEVFAHLPLLDAIKNLPLVSR